MNISPRMRSLVISILFISTFISLSSQTMMITAINQIAQDMNISLNTAQWLTTGYVMMIGVITPLSATLYHKMTNRHYYLSTIGIFIIGTLIGCVAHNFLSLLAARFIQAVASGLLISFQMTTLVSLYPPEKRGTMMGLASLIVAFGPAIGPTLGGFILTKLNWHYFFIIFLPIMLALWVIGFFVFPNFSQPKPVKIEVYSLLLSLFGVGLTMFGISSISTQTVIGSLALVIGLILIVIFIRRQLGMKEPFLKIQLFKYRSFWLLTVVSVLTFMILIGTEQMLALFVEQVSHVSSMQSGMILLPGAVLNAVCASFAGRIYDKFGPKYLVLIGFAIMILAAVPFTMLTAQTPIWWITLCYALRMIGNALVFSATMSESFLQVPASDTSHATAINNSVRQIGGATITTLLIVIANLPQSFVAGMQLTMWITIALALLGILLFVTYLRKGDQ